jgi:hypothetical protein
MSVAKSTAILLLSLLSTAVEMGQAAACSCLATLNRPKDIKTDDQISAWKLERAANVVRGRITQVRAGDDVVRGGHPVVAAKMNITSVVKGDVPLGEATIITGFGTGDCGVAGVFLVAVGWQRDLITEVERIPSLPGELTASVCGYGKLVGAKD